MLEILITSVLFSDDSVFFPSSSWLFFDKSILSTEVEDANDEILIPVVSLVVSLLLVS